MLMYFYSNNVTAELLFVKEDFYIAIFFTFLSRSQEMIYVFVLLVVFFFPFIFLS